ncbi:hypothetical protein CXR27_03930 [Brevibacterium aurantiacum]|uniref:DUF4760 domain-containing protein n=1 Tax=Brevibacterium aurantiacum TaxID=273384 RepID=A0A2A3X5B6_BREAU|nr:hypothetical protein CXR27_03930 [Brevibacterium aurantiacum]PCC18902.1 hypothetical protein CIK79_11730 [Brevibacterium aurantiacum]
MGLWIAAIGAVGVIVGALINTSLSVWSSSAQRKLDATLAVRQEKINQYFDALDTLYMARDALQTFKEANSGLGIEKGKRKSKLPWKNRDYKAYDKTAADAFEALDSAARSVAVQRARIDVVGTADAADAFEDCYGIVFGYLKEVVNQVEVDGKFIYKTWEHHWNDYNEQVAKTLRIFRKDVSV